MRTIAHLKKKWPQSKLLRGQVSSKVDDACCRYQPRLFDDDDSAHSLRRANGDREWGEVRHGLNLKNYTREVHLRPPPARGQERPFVPPSAASINSIEP